MKDLNWYQNKAVSLISMILAVVSVCSLVVSILWYGRVLDQMSKDVSELKDSQEQQLVINTKLLTIIELRK
jgi:hypothetical protein